MNWRFQATFIFFVLLLFAVVARLFYWQVVRADELNALGESQYGQKIKLAPKRGEIRTSDGFPIAANTLSYLVFANPKVTTEKEKTSLLLAPILETEPASISAMLDLNRFWVALKPDLTADKKEQVEKLNLEGIGFEEQYLRYYPEASTAAKLLGFVGKDENGDLKGYFGLEGYYDMQLRGKTGLAVQVKDAMGRPILAKMNEKTAAIDGRSIILHIDRSLQFIAEMELKKDIERYGAKGGMVGILNPKTGSVLAMASFPSYDPKDYYEYSEDLYKDSFITDTYEPGSTFKPLIMAAGIDSGVVKANTRCTICSGPVELGGYEIKTWNDKYHPNATMTEIIRYSDNTGMVFVGQKLGLPRLLGYLKRFGIGELTGIDLQGETTPDLRPEEDWYPIDLATATFGQGISVTAMELLSAFSAIANDGKRMEPHVVASIETPEGQIIKIPPKEINKPIAAPTAKIMTEILVNAVDEGEAKWAKPKGYRIAGKTGTAQIPVEGHYDPKNTIASFIGFAPADDPKFAMLVVYDRPSSSIYGSETAAPTFFNIARDILAYYGVTPTEAE